MVEPLLILSGVAAQIDAVLPQTQCTRCGYPDCAHYAQALSLAQADIDQCPPGGAEGVRRIAAVLQQQPKPLNPQHGVESPRTLALIDENWCIGCTLCLDACPTDAILGASKRMHTVVPEHCTGCELCIPVCPVDCIQLVPTSNRTATGWAGWSSAQANNARGRYAQHHARGAHRQLVDAKAAVKQCKEPGFDGNNLSVDTSLDVKQRVIQLALAKARKFSGAP